MPFHLFMPTVLKYLNFCQQISLPYLLTLIISSIKWKHFFLFPLFLLFYSSNFCMADVYNLYFRDTVTKFSSWLSLQIGVMTCYSQDLPAVYTSLTFNSVFFFIFSEIRTTYRFFFEVRTYNSFSPHTFINNQHVTTQIHFIRV